MARLSQRTCTHGHGGSRHWLPRAEAVHWPEIVRLFRAGVNTYEIGLILGLDEFAVANVLPRALEVTQ
ncbi:MAG: hypothetical protein JWM36_4366 [Hyphomicrobiales bacterium]|nr:hypothetical protein [Hyphomicrobiales bacterium]